jgi:hypothetical protein
LTPDDARSARRGGRGIVERYGPFIGVGAAQLDRAEKQLGGLILVRRGLPHPLPRPLLRASQPLKVGLVAGLLASFGALWTLDLVVVVAGDVAWRLPDSLPAVAAAQVAQALTRDATGGLLWLVMPVLAGVGWGAQIASPSG